MSKHEYRRLLFDISEKINANELRKMVYLCIDDLPKGTRRDSFEDALALFDLLETKNRLGIDNTQILKGMLQNLPKKPLLRKVEDFEIKRKAQSFGIISSLKRAAETLSGAVRMVCNFRTLAGGMIFVGGGLALRSCSSFEEYSDAFNKVVLPAFTKLVELSESSLCFTVLAETPSALKELWNIYNNETLKNRLQSFLVTEEIKQLASGEEMEVTVYIDGKEYRAAYLDLMFQQNRAADNISQEGGTRRRNSDSFLFLSPNEDEVTLMKLNQAENKWNFKVQILETEIDNLRSELAISGENVKMGKIGRRRKYTHRKYENSQPTGNQQTSSSPVLRSCQQPTEYQFPLRHLPPGILHQPSLYNYMQVFSVLCESDVLKNNWNLIKHSELFLMLCTFTNNAPEKTLIVNTDFTFIILASNRNVTEFMENGPEHLTNLDSFLCVLRFVDVSTICPGIKNEKLKGLAHSGGRNGVFKDRHGMVKANLSNDVIRPVVCRGLWHSGLACDPCKAYKKTLLTMLSNQKSNNEKLSISSHCAWSRLSEKEKEERIKNCTLGRKIAAKKMHSLEEKFNNDLIALSEEDNKVVTKLFAEVEKISQEEPENFKSLFIQQQQKALTCADNRGRRWHPLIIRWCFQLYSSSPKAYQFLKDTGVLLLPDKRTLRDYSNCFKVDSGLDSGFLDLVKKDFINRSDPKDSDVWVGIIHDEVSLRKDLVFDDSGKLIGFVDLGSVQNSIDDLEQCLSAEQNSPITPEEATHMFVFMVVSLFSDWRMPVAFFPTTTIKSYALFNLFWKCIEELEQREFRVLTSTCDGASPHRLFYKYHIPPGAPKGTIIYKTNNHYAFEKRPLYFICDPVHLLKTTRNNWENSFWRNKTKKLRNNGMWITWLQLIDAFENDVNSSNVSGLRLLHKLTADHIFLNPYLRMRVYLAAQVFSNRVAHAITEQGKPGTEETVKFVQNMNDFFDCLNANRMYTQYEFKSVYRTPTDRRLHWLENDFLKYFQDWKDWAMGQEDVPLLERKQYFISDQTWEGLQICVKSFVEVVKFSLNIPGVNFVVATKFNQDLLEKFFGKLRQKRGAYGAFTCKEFSQSYSNCVFSQSHAIKTVRRIKRRGDALEDLDADLPLPKNKRR